MYFIHGTDGKIHGPLDLEGLRQRIAEGLGLTLGDEIKVNVLGRETVAKVASLRKVDWRSYGINFVMVFSPNAFAGAPFTQLMTLTTPPTGVWGRYDANNSALPFLNPGWNWISMPAPPAFNNNPASFTGFSLPILFNNLYRWQNYTIELYTSDFTTVEGYRGYTLRLDNRIPAVSYQALYPSCPDAEITLIGGWNWIGVPITMSQTAMKVRKDLTGEVRTVAQDAAMGAGAWLNYNWVFYDSADRTVRLVNYMPGADDTLLRPWFGYQVFVGTLPPGETYTLIVPTR